MVNYKLFRLLDFNVISERCSGLFKTRFDGVKETFCNHLLMAHIPFVRLMMENGLISFGCENGMFEKMREFRCEREDFLKQDVFLFFQLLLFILFDFIE